MPGRQKSLSGVCRYSIISSAGFVKCDVKERPRTVMFSKNVFMREKIEKLSVIGVLCSCLKPAIHYVQRM